MKNEFDRFPDEVFHPTGSPEEVDQLLRKTGDQRWREIFDFTGYIRANETPKKIPQEVKPAKKIPYYHHKRRF